MWSVFGIFYLIALIQSQLNQNKALNTTEYSPIWKTDDVLTENAIKQQYSLITRPQWDIHLPTTNLLNLQLPAQGIIMTHTQSQECHTQAECVARIKNMQLSNGGIGYNFLIGGDGSVYEGYDWNQIETNNKCINNSSICIAFIGDFNATKPLQNQLNAAQLLIDDGLRLGKLTYDYKLYAHTQLTPQLNSGNELFKLIQKSPHFNEYSTLTNDFLLKFVSRSNWNAQPSIFELNDLLLPIKLVILAHTATRSCFTQAECKHHVRNMQTFHIESRGFNDIGYNFLVGGDGSIYEGRGWDKIGVHTKGYNAISICIAFIGNFQFDQPTPQQLNATLQLIEYGVRLGKLSVDYEIKGQKQLVATESPGRILFNIIENWQHFPQNNSKKMNMDKSHILENKPVHRYIPRWEWNAQPPTEPLENQNLPIQRVIIAHTATEPCSNQAQCTSRVRYIQTFHIESRGFDDIAYNFLIGGDGSIYEGRGWDKVGVHTKSYNYDSVCIAFIGTFNTVAPSKSQLTAAITLIEDGIKFGKLNSNYDLYGHKQLIPTTSPGQKLFDVISSWPHFFKVSETQDVGKLSVDNEIKNQKQLVATESPDAKKVNTENNHILEKRSLHRYITRMEWIAQAPTEPSKPQTLPIQRVIIAHTATESCFNQAQCTFRVRFIQTFHIESRGFDDIAYNFLIGGDGFIYEGRGWDKVGAHTKGFNYDSVCIAFIGTFNTIAPSESQLTAAITLIEDGIKFGKLNSNYDLYGHKQLIPTTSPGQKLFDVISTWPHFFKESEIQGIGKLSVDNEMKDQKQLVATESPDSKKFTIDTDYIIKNNFSHKYITRMEWVAQAQSEFLLNLTLPINRVIIAHTATEPCSTQAQCTFRVRYLQTIHIESRGFDDIVYNFLIGGDGSIYEGRGWDKVGAHTKGYNYGSVCIAFIGTFDTVPPSQPQLTAAIKLIEDGIKLGKINSNYNLYGHKQLISTTSPGQKLFDVISTWPHFFKESETQDKGKLSVDNEIKDQKQLVTTERPHSKQFNTDNNHILENKSLHRYITRMEWIAQAPNEPSIPQTLPIERVIIAHTATEPCSTQAQCTFRVRYIQTFHIESLGFDDIAYNFLIGGDGSIYEGRGWDKVGAHTKGYNYDSVCIAFIGTFDTVPPNQSQLTAAIKLIEDGIKSGKINSNYNLYGHKQLISTTSPGQKLFDVISTWPHFFKESETQDIGKLSVDNEIKDQKQLVTTESPHSKQFNTDNNHILENKSLHRYITRMEWIAQTPTEPSIPQTLPIRRVIIAHTATEPCSTQAQCTFRVRYIQTFHIESRGFDDIAYNFLIGGDGSIYEGRGWDKVGAHTKGYNYDSVCIAFIGTFDTVPPSQSQLTAAIKLIEDGIKLGKINSNYNLYGHKQLISTTSPGQKLFDVISTWPHFFKESETQDIGKLSVDNEIKDQKQLVTTESPHSKQLNTEDNHILEKRSLHRYITRMEWIAQAPTEPSKPQTLPIQRVIIAHTATEPCSTQAQCTFRVRYIQTFHIESRGFDDIAYNFLIGGDGSIYEGRGWDKVGAHTKGYNYDSVCIAFIGTFNTIAPSESQLTAAITLIEDGIKFGKLNSNYDLYGHKQLIPTTSPGQKLFDVISTWPHFFKESETQDINTTLYKVKT